MKQATGNKRYLGLILYGILLTAGVLYYRFPSDALGDYLEATADRMIPRLLISVGRARPIFPLGLKFQQTEISEKANPVPLLFSAEDLLIRFGLWSWLRGKMELCFDCAAYEGELSGCADFTEKSMKSPFTSSIELTDIRIDNYAYLSALAGRNLKGILAGDIEYSGKYDSLIDGTGAADLKISDGRIELLQPVLSYKSIDFDGLQVKLVLKKRMIELTSVELKGRDIKGEVSGNIRLKTDLLKSALYIKGTVEPLAGFFKDDESGLSSSQFLKQRLKKGKLSFTIRGTFESPRFKLL
jgi:type II secretion system protein N